MLFGAAHGEQDDVGGVEMLAHPFPGQLVEAATATSPLAGCPPVPVVVTPVSY